MRHVLERGGIGHVYGVGSMQKVISVSCQERTKSARLLAGEFSFRIVYSENLVELCRLLPYHLHRSVFMGGWNVESLQLAVVVKSEDSLLGWISIYEPLYGVY